MVSLETAKELIWEQFQEFPIRTAEVDLIEGLNYIVAEDIVSPVNVPGFTRSMSDGYAVISSDTLNASDNHPISLSCQDQIHMGQSTSTIIKNGECAYVPTGGMIPAGADAVVMVEHTGILENEKVDVYMAASPGERVIVKGDDIKAGQLLLKRGAQLKARHIGSLAAAGIHRVVVYQGPKYSIIATGDELVGPREKLLEGQIWDSNSFALAAFIKKFGGEILRQVIVGDDMNQYRREVENALVDSDIILISGGCSVGIRDYTAEVINSLPGKGVFIQGVKIRPGRPVIVGETQGKPVFGLPGHPVAPVIIYKIMVESLLRRLMGCQEETMTAILDFDMHPALYSHLIVSVENRQGQLYAQPGSLGNPARTSSIAGAHGYIQVPDMQTGLSRGEVHEVNLF